MRLVISQYARVATIVLALFVLTLGISSNAVAVEFNLLGPTEIFVEPGEQFVVDLTVTNLSQDSIIAVGASVHDYDESIVDFSSGQAVTSIFNAVCTAPGSCFGGLPNVAGPNLVESSIGPFGNRVEVIAAAVIPALTGPIGVDQGLDGNVGTAMFSLVFDAISPGVTTLLYDVSYSGDGVVAPDGNLIPAYGSSLTVTVVPEPGTALLLGLGMMGLALSGRSVSGRSGGRGALLGLAALLATPVFLSAPSASAVEVSVVGSNSVTVLPGEQVAIDMIIRNPTAARAAGLGYSAHGYDETVADFVSGEAVSSYLTSICVAPGSCFGGLNNIASPLEESSIGTNGPRVQFALSASIVAVTNSGDTDQGLDGLVGTPQFRLLFEAIAPGITTILLDTAYEGDALILLDPVQTVQGGGTTFTINVVPEPGTALLMGLGLVGLAASGRSRVA